MTGTLDVTGNSTFSTLSSTDLAEFDTLNVNNGATIDSGGFTVTAGGAAITGDTTITGNLNVSGTVTSASIVSTYDNITVSDTSKTKRFECCRGWPSYQTI